MRRRAASLLAFSTALAMISPALRARRSWSIGARPDRLLCCRCRVGGREGGRFARTGKSFHSPVLLLTNVDLLDLVPRVLAVLRRDDHSHVPARDTGSAERVDWSASVKTSSRRGRAEATAAEFPHFVTAITFGREFLP